MKKIKTKSIYREDRCKTANELNLLLQKKYNCPMLPLTAPKWRETAINGVYSFKNYTFELTTSPEKISDRELECWLRSCEINYPKTKRRSYYFLKNVQWERPYYNADVYDFIHGNKTTRGYTDISQYGKLD